MSDWSRRALVSDTAVARLRRWKLRGTELAVVEAKSKVGLPTRYLVVQRTPNGGEVVLSRHRHRQRAIQAAEKASV